MSKKRKAGRLFAAAPWLGQRFIGKSCNDSARPALRKINDASTQLAEMLDYPGPMAVLIESLERKGVRLSESDLPDCDITHKNQYVAVIGGKSAEFLSRLHERLESGATAEEALQYARLLSRGADFGLVHERDLRAGDVGLDITHKRSWPNDQAHRSGQ